MRGPETPGPGTAGAGRAGHWERLQSEAVSIVSEAGAAGVTLRVVGSAGIRLHCPGPGPVMDRLGRPAKDIDFVVPQQHRKGMRRFLEARGYVIDRDLLIAMEGRRYSFTHPGHGTDIDVFVERLEFCHTIEVRDRLDTHPVTIGLEELLLQKVQIIEMTTTDVIDSGALLATHRVSPASAGPADTGPADAGHADAPPADAGPAGAGPAADGCRELIDGGRIARLLARDWGFHHTATRNLRRVRDGAGDAATDFGPEANSRVRARAGQLLDAIDAEPKSARWRMRDRVGERKQWWQDVDEVEATY
jgi:hypothetical protein